MSDAFRISEESPARVRIERSAGGKVVKMLTVSSDAATDDVTSAIDKAVAAFAYFENKVAREIEGHDLPASARPKATDLDRFEV